MSGQLPTLQDQCVATNSLIEPRSEVGTTKLKQAAYVARNLVRYNAMSTFAADCEGIMKDWIMLLRNTMLPVSATSSDPKIVAAFKAVDSLICGPQTPRLLRRLAYVQLMRIFASLENIIKADRECESIICRPYYRNASVALDIYSSAQGTHSGAGNVRRILKERKRAGRSWRDLAKVSPLFVIVYSDAAESIIKRFKKTDSVTLKLAAAKIVEECPKQLISICVAFSEKAESLADNDGDLEISQIQSAFSGLSIEPEQP